MAQRTEPSRQLPEGLVELIKNAVNEAFAEHQNVNTAIESLRIQHSNIADYQMNCRCIASYLGMQDEVMDIPNRIIEKIT